MVLLLLFGVYSPSVSAAETSNLIFKMGYYSDQYGLNEMDHWIASDGSYTSHVPLRTANDSAGTDYIYVSRESGVMIPAGSSGTISVYNIVSYFKALNGSALEDNYGNMLDFVIDAIIFEGYDLHGNLVRATSSEQGSGSHLNVLSPYAYSSGSLYNLSFEYKNIPADIYTVRIRIVYNSLATFGDPTKFGTAPLRYWGLENPKGTVYYDNTEALIANLNSQLQGRFDSLDAKLSQQAQKQEEANGLLANIKDGISNLFNAIQNVVSSIVQLPSKLMDALKGFFLPDEDFIAGYKAKFENLLSSHLGALYQSIDAFKSLDDAFSSAVTTQDSIQMPEVTVTLAGTDYTFGGYTVKMIPDKIVPIVNILKTLLGIVATLLFVNMLKHRYEGVVSK